MTRLSDMLHFVLGLLLLGAAVSSVQAADDEARRPVDDGELRGWLTNMVGYHRYSNDEVSAATGLSPDEVTAALERWDIAPGKEPSDENRLLVLPYPGGRHPRIGFLDGAVDPQRETKVSVFTPWHDLQADRADYVVVDVPEAIWSNLGLTYLAHTHIPTIWDEQGVAMEKLEWERRVDGSLTHTRTLPNGIRFTSSVFPRSDHVRMRMTLTNGTEQVLSDLRVQNCVMLKGASGFSDQTNENKRLEAPYAAVHDEAGRRWVITAWVPNQRTWANERCPCLHSDPQFPDCEPGATETIDGWLSFYEGTEIESEIARIKETGWWTVEP